MIWHAFKLTKLINKDYDDHLLHHRDLLLLAFASEPSLLFHWDGLFQALHVGHESHKWLQEIESISQALTPDLQDILARISFKCNPPSAPHFGEI